jgi:hypothetical protein
MEDDKHVPDASLPDMVGEGEKPDRELPVLIYSASYVLSRIRITAQVTSLRAHTVNIHECVCRSHTSCNGSFWSENTVDGDR